MKNNFESKSSEKSAAVFIPTLQSGGAEKQAVLLASVLAEKYPVLVLVGNQTDKEKKEFLDSLTSQPQIRIEFLCGGFLAKYRRSYQLLKEFAPSALFNYLTACDVWGGIIGKAAGIPLIFGGIRSSRLPFHKYFMEMLAHNLISTKTIFNSRSGLEYFCRRGFASGKAVYIPNCFECKEENIERNTANKVLEIISVGRFVPEKDYATALKSMALLKKQEIPFKYQIIGYGALESDIRALIKQLDLEAQVEIVISPNDIPQRLQRADIYLSTSLFEGTSNSILEAMAAKLPVVATGVGDNKVLIQEQQGGIIVPVGRAEVIANALAQLIANEQLRLAFGEYNREQLLDTFSRESFQASYEQLLAGD